MRYIVLGSSAAGINGIRELRRRDPKGEIVLISEDTDIYSRCILHHYLGGKRSLKQLCFAEENFIEAYRVQGRMGTGCTGVDAGKKQVLLADGERMEYDRLLIATGAHTYLPPIPHVKEAQNVIGFRNIEDIETLRKASVSAKSIVVVGAGLVGLDCVSGLLDLEVKPVLVETADWLLSRQLDRRAAKTYQDAFAEKGVVQYYGTSVREAVLNDRQEITELLLSDGSRLPCDFLVVTAGVRPNVEFLEGSGIQMTQKGLWFDETGKTSCDGVYGAGDVSGTRPIWPAAVKEGITAAGNMAGFTRRMTDFFASKAAMNFLGIPSMSLGACEPADQTDTVEVKETADSYKKIIHKNGKITGAVLQGDLSYGGILQQLIARRIDVSKVKKPVFDIDYSDFFHLKDNFEYDYEGDS